MFTGCFENLFEFYDKQLVVRCFIITRNVNSPEVFLITLLGICWCWKVAFLW